MKRAAAGRRVGGWGVRMWEQEEEEVVVKRQGRCQANVARHSFQSPGRGQSPPAFAAEALSASRSGPPAPIFLPSVRLHRPRCAHSSINSLLVVAHPLV